MYYTIFHILRQERKTEIDWGMNDVQNDTYDSVKKSKVSFLFGRQHVVNNEMRNRIDCHKWRNQVMIAERGITRALFCRIIFIMKIKLFVNAHGYRDSWLLVGKELRRWPLFHSNNRDLRDRYGLNCNFMLSVHWKPFRSSITLTFYKNRNKGNTLFHKQNLFFWRNYFAFLLKVAAIQVLASFHPSHPSLDINPFPISMQHR